MPQPGVPLVVTFTVSDNCQTVSCTARFFINPCALCTYTQGAYGSEGGAMCDGTVGGLSTAEMIEQCLTNSGGTITIGRPGRSVVMSLPSAVDCIIDKLPGGGSATELLPGNANICTLQPAYLKNGRIKNVLLAQTITLALNSSIESPSDLSGFKLQAGTIATANPLGGCGSSTPVERVCGHYDDNGIWVNTTNEYSYRTISAAVVNAITPNGNGDKTVAGLVDLANRALGNADGVVGSEGGVSLSAINAAVDAINNVFDECKIFIGWDVAPCSAPPARISRDVIASNDKSTLSVVAYPNPYSNSFNLKVNSTDRNNVIVTVFDMTGRLIEKKEMNVNEVSEIQIGNNYSSGVYNVIVNQGEEVKTVRVIKR